jgi:hypothetical protein
MVNYIDPHKSVRYEVIVGANRPSNLVWSMILLCGGSGFIATSVSSKTGVNIFPFLSAQEITFIPQGLVMGFYGALAMLLSMYLILTVLWNVGGGFNEFNQQTGQIQIFRWGFPGTNRRIDLRFPMTDVEAVRIEIQEGVNPRRILYLRLKGRRELPLNRVGPPLTLGELEKQGAELAGFLQVPLEGL